MKRSRDFVLVLVTAPELKTARRLARGAVTARLAACVNLVPKLESHYRWQGKLEQGREVLLLFKTAAKRIAALEAWLIARHPYDTPEFIVLPLSGGNQRYLEWLAGSMK